MYEVVQDDRNEEQQQQLHLKREAATATTTFYDLLQAVNYSETTCCSLSLSQTSKSSTDVFYKTCLKTEFFLFQETEMHRHACKIRKK